MIEERDGECLLRRERERERAGGGEREHDGGT